MKKQLPFKFGAEVYTWFMNNDGETYKGQLGHMIEVIAKSGFTGIQPIYSWMGDLSDPARLKDKLNDAINLLQHFPGAILCTVQKPTGRNELTTRRSNLVNIVNQVSRRAMEKGVTSSFHPNSPHTSITRTEEDYKVILETLDNSVTGWCPDVGHIINGGMDPLEKMKEYRSLINHVHYKDWDGEPEFALMGKGKVDLLGITQWLKDNDYKGWIICEDEGKEALEDPDFVTLHDGRCVNENLLPRLK